MFVVAGVTGHVGAVVASELLSHGEKVKVIVRDAQKGAAWSKKGAEVAVGTLGDVRFLTETLKGAEGFFALVPPNYQASPFLESQYKVADAIATAVKESKVPHVAVLSSVGSDLPSGTGPILATHRLEQQLRTGSAILSIVRAGSFAENVGMALGMAREKGIFISMSPSADYAVPQIATHDIGMLLAHQLLLPPARSEVIDLYGPAYAPREIAEKLGKALGKKLEVVTIPASEQAAAMQKAGMNAEMANLMVEMNGSFASGRIKPVGDRAKQGRTTIDQVIAQMLAAPAH